MLSLYEILKASKTGVAPDMWTALAGMNWGGADSGHEVKELTGIPPLSFRADGTPLLDFLISGNMAQSGTPTPDNPIQPSECGDLETSGAKAGQYKIPISSANTTTPVYLGEVETTRKIVKKTFNGSESFSLGSVIGQIRFNTGLTLIDNAAICSHYILKETYSSTGKPYIRLRSNTVWFELDDTGYETKEACLADFITYLTQQYAAGTPVTVWYALATETTGIVNEPLRKIGDYADTLSMEQAGVSIPTNNGSTTVDVETTLKPSEMYIKYKG